VATRLEGGRGLIVVTHRLGDVRGLPVGRAVADHHVAARCQRVAQLSDQDCGRVGVGEEVQHGHEQQRDRLGQVHQLQQLRVAQDLPGAAQVRLDRDRVLVTGQDHPAVLNGDRVVVDVDDAGIRGGVLGDLVDVTHGRDARADVEELADARLPGEMADGTA
jgi:hypothetical protein